MIATLLLALNLLSCATANTLNTLRIPTQRKTLNVNTSAVLPHPINYNDDWAVLGYYFIELGIGTPPQLVQLGLDTGSSDMWVPLANVSHCLKSQCPAGTFDPARSSTYRLADRRPFDIGYVDQSTIKGNYSSDTVILEGASLSNFTFAVANDLGADSRGDANTHFGLLGLGTQELETDACKMPNCSGGVRTPTFTDALVNSGYIESSSYSLFLDDRKSGSGSILFGGVDTAKFKGPLITLHSMPQGKESPLSGQQIYQSLRLANLTTHINGVLDAYCPLGENVDKGNLSHTGSTGIEAHLDSGSNVITIPHNCTEILMPRLPIEWNLTMKYGNLAGLPLTFCDTATADIFFTFTLEDDSGISTDIHMPVHELVTPLRNGSYDRFEPIYEGGRPVCVVTLSSGFPGGKLILGDPFLRSAYTFFNIEQHTISIAQAASNPKSEHIVAIGKGPVPKLTGTA